MIFLESPSLDPYFNLALEEHLFRTLGKGQELLMLWQNANSIIVGRFQNTAEEINQAYVDAHDIKVARRLSGGGAVYHDTGNLNYTLITDSAELDALNFRAFAQPVLRVLDSLGVCGEFSGRNDLLIDGRKFSGCSQFSDGKRLLLHGCILLHSNLDVLERALTVRSAKLRSHGVRSVSSRVTSICDHLSAPVSISVFQEALTQEILSGREAEPYRLTAQDLLSVSRLREEKYATWAWNYGDCADYEMSHEGRFQAGTLQVKMNVQGGYIQGIRLFGDFFASGDLSVLERRLTGLPLDGNLEAALEDCGVSTFISGLSAKDLRDLLMYA